MIPIDPDKPVRVTAENDGVTYDMRVLTEDNEEQFNTICKMYTDGDEQKNKEYAIALIDFFVVGWSGAKVPEFPKDGKPSRYFINSAMKIKMVNFILDNLDRLKGISTEEIKN